MSGDFRQELNRELKVLVSHAEHHHPELQLEQYGFIKDLVETPLGTEYLVEYENGSNIIIAYDKTHVDNEPWIRVIPRRHASTLEVTERMFVQPRPALTRCDEGRPVKRIGDLYAVPAKFSPKTRWMPEKDLRDGHEEPEASPFRDYTSLMYGFGGEMRDVKAWYLMHLEEKRDIGHLVDEYKLGELIARSKTGSVPQHKIPVMCRGLYMRWSIQHVDNQFEEVELDKDESKWWRVHMLDQSDVFRASDLGKNHDNKNCGQ